jgi:phosphoribosylamine--glycine ligase
MGGFSTGRLLPFMKEADLETARKALEGIVSALRAKGTAYRGPVRGEFIATKKGTLMLCAHATFGDMDSLCNLPLLRSQLSETLASAAHGRLTPMSFIDRHTVVKFLVPEGYPGKGKLKEIRIDEKRLWNNGAKAYYESVEMKKGRMLPLGGRTLAICAMGATVPEAHRKTEEAASAVDGALRHREDIGTVDYVNRCAKHLGLIRSH